MDRESFPSYQEPAPRPKGYEFFNDSTERWELVKYSQKIAEYLRSEQIPNLVVIDRSSRPLYVGVQEYWRAEHPDEPRPNIYFMNPKGFKAREDLTPSEIQQIIDDCNWKDDADESRYQVRSQDEIMEEFQGTYKHLMEDKDKPVLIFDTCIHSGDSLASVKNAFDEAGFEDARIGAVNPSESRKVQTDFFITRQHPEKGCYPFDRDRMIEKTFDHVYSQPTNDPEKRERSVRLRQEIQRIMRESLGQK